MNNPNSKIRLLFIVGPTLLLIAAAFAADGAKTAAAEADAQSAPMRIVSIGGSATEILFAVGAGPEVVAVDQSSTWPPEVAKLPLIGYIRVINPEGVLAARPSLIVTTSDLGPPESAAKLEGAGVPILKVPAPNSPESVAAAITAIAERVGKADAGLHVREEFEAKIKNTQEVVSQMSIRPKVALFMSVEGSSFNAAGAGTKADALIRLAGGTNVFGGFNSYKPVSAEAVVAATPDVILIATTPDRLKEAEKSVLENPALAVVPARKSRRVLVLDLGAALNFGPRLADTVLTLAEYFSKPPPAHSPTVTGKP